MAIRFESTIFKINKQGQRVMSVDLYPGERLVNGATYDEVLNGTPAKPKGDHLGINDTVQRGMTTDDAKISTVHAQATADNARGENTRTTDDTAETEVEKKPEVDVDTEGEVKTADKEESDESVTAEESHDNAKTDPANIAPVATPESSDDASANTAGTDADAADQENAAAEETAPAAKRPSNADDKSTWYEYSKTKGNTDDIDANTKAQLIEKYGK